MSETGAESPEPQMDAAEVAPAPGEAEAFVATQPIGRAMQDLLGYLESAAGAATGDEANQLLYLTEFLREAPPSGADSPEEEQALQASGIILHKELLSAGTLLKSYAAAVQDAGLKKNPLVERSLLESAEAKKSSFSIESRGNNPHTFSSRICDQHAELLGKVLTCPPVSPTLFLAHLDLSFNNITDVGACALAESGLFGPDSWQLDTVLLRGNAIGPDGCGELATALSVCPRLRVLDMACNPIGSKGGIELCGTLQSCPRLEALYLKDTEIDIDAIVHISTVLLMTGHPLKILDLENPRILTKQEEHTVHIGRMLRVNVNISEIYLGKLRMRDEGVRQLVSFLLENKTLRVLDLRCNELGADGASHLANLLSDDCQLRKLNLESNRIGERANINGAVVFANALKKNRMLSSLSLNNNSLCGEALQAIADACETNTTLEVLELFQNDWDQISSYKFHQILTGGVRPLQLRTDFVTSEVGLRIDVCQLQGFKAGGG